MVQETINAKSDNQGVTSYPSQIMGARESMASIASLMKEIQNLLPVLRREFRGEALQQHPDGSYAYIQVSKPYFVKVNPESGKPLKIKVTYKNEEGEKYLKEVYIANDEAIEEILSILKSMGNNQITPLTNIDEGTILEDLKEFECKLAGLLMLKQKSWGIDKELLPMVQIKIKTIVQDVRYLCCNGGTIKAIQKTVQRVEQAWEGEKPRGFFKKSPYA